MVRSLSSSITSLWRFCGISTPRTPLRWKWPSIRTGHSALLKRILPRPADSPACGDRHNQSGHASTGVLFRLLLNNNAGGLLSRFHGFCDQRRSTFGGFQAFNFGADISELLLQVRKLRQLLRSQRAAAGVNGCQGLNLFVDTRTLTTQFFNMWHFISLFLDIKKQPAGCLR